MKKGMGWIIPVAVIVILAFMVMGSYNGLVTQNENVNNKWSNIQTNLQRRADLIPNLVSTVKGYASHESEIFTAVAEARSKLIGANTKDEVEVASGEFENTLGRLLAISESYPQLKADANFRQLNDELTGTENRIGISRQEYNEAVNAYNTKIKRFPTVILANMFGFEAKTYFEVEEGKTAVPKGY